MHTHTLSLTHIHSLTHTHFLFQFRHTQRAEGNYCAGGDLCQTHTHTHAHTHTFTLTRTHSHTFSLTHTHSLSSTHTLSLSLSLQHTHSLSQSRHTQRTKGHNFTWGTVRPQEDWIWRLVREYHGTQTGTSCVHVSLGYISIGSWIHGTVWSQEDWIWRAWFVNIMQLKQVHRVYMMYPCISSMYIYICRYTYIYTHVYHQCIYIYRYTYIYTHVYHPARLQLSSGQTRRVTHMNESCHTHDWVRSHTWMSHVTHINE